MDKSSLIFSFMIILMISFTTTLENPSTGIGSEDAENIQGAIDDYVPINDSGKIDFEKYQPFKTKAEERINAINSWLEENASWLKIIFGMVPSISLLFAINFYILLFFIVTLILNANATFGLFESLNQKIDLGFFEISWANLFGSAIFIIFLITKIFVKLANIVYGLWGIFWNYILPWGFAIAVIIAILVGIIFIFLLVSAPQVLLAIKKGIDERKEKEESAKTAVNREVLEKIVTGATRP